MPTPNSARLTDIASLGQLAEVLLLSTEHRTPGADPALLVRVEADPGATRLPPEFDVGLGELSPELGDHPAQMLRGFVAPDTWWAIGVVSSGLARVVGGAEAETLGLDPGRPEPDEAPPTGRVQVAHLVARTGESVLALRHELDDTFHVASSDDAVPGLLADACRRSLGLAAAPPLVSPAAYWEDLWLESLMGEAMHWPVTVDWPIALSLHPLRRHLHRNTGPEVLGHVVRDRARLGWAPLLADASVHGVVLADGTCCPAHLASWFDEGSFSRAVSGVLPHRDVLLEVLPDLVDPAVLAAVTSALRASEDD